MSSKNQAKKQLIKIKWKELLSWLLVVILLVGLALGFLTGRLQFNRLADANTKNAAGSYCDSELIKQYQAAARVFMESYRSDAQAYQQLKEQIEKRSGYERDPNCVYVLTNYAIDIGDSDSALTMIDRLAELYDKGQFVDGRYLDAISLDGLKTRVALIQVFNGN